MIIKDTIKNLWLEIFFLWMKLLIENLGVIRNAKNDHFKTPSLPPL